MQALADAYAHLQNGQLEQAEAACRAALSRAPNAAAHRTLAEISRLRHDLTGALEHARRALDLDPKQPDSLLCCGTLFLQSGDIDAAIEHLDRAIERRLRFDKAHDALCVALERRAKYEGRYLVSVITATIGRGKLRRTIDSVQAQTHPRIEHVIVIDGPDAVESIRQALPSHTRHDIHLVPLPFNTGADGYLAHRIDGFIVYLVNGRYIAFLNDDNWFEPHHIASLMELIESKGLEWSYALRNIVDTDGSLITQDDCESLGRWPVWNAPTANLVDMNCYLLRRDIAIRLSPTFHRRAHDGQNPDFRLCRYLLETAPRFDTNGDYTVNYTAENRPNSVKADFFLAGNQVMAERHGGDFPWRKRRPASGSPVNLAG